MVSIIPLVSISPSLFTWFVKSVPMAPITIDTIDFFCSQAKSKHLFICIAFFYFRQRSAGRGKSTTCTFILVSSRVVFWPSTRPNMPFQSDAPEGSYTFQLPVIERNRVGGLADEMGQGKSPWYTHRLMHRKRVTCELHDSYFRLMTIKHAIPKIEWAIEWALNYYITRSRQEDRQLEIRRVRDKMW